MVADRVRVVPQDLRRVVDRALVAAASLILTPQAHIALSQAGFLAPDGRCKVFDARADGFARAEPARAARG